MYQLVICKIANEQKYYNLDRNMQIITFINISEKEEDMMEFPNEVQSKDERWLTKMKMLIY